MIKKLFHTLKGRKREESDSDFSTFFREASREDKEKLLLEVTREANQDQREIVERYNDMQAKSSY
ncbi:MAG: hypothetical protein HY606_02395 [Planctomycetes bacterium]|nr:hypothetical protein [Planctomycetota bacterium]